MDVVHDCISCIVVANKTLKITRPKFETNRTRTTCFVTFKKPRSNLEFELDMIEGIS